MKPREIWPRAKPYVTGGIGGIAVAAIIAFSAGWIVTSGTMVQGVDTARTDAYASVCADRSLARWSAAGNAMEALEGYSNEERDALVAENMPELGDDVALQRAVRRSCRDKIRAKV